MDCIRKDCGLYKVCIRRNFELYKDCMRKDCEFLRIVDCVRSDCGLYKERKRIVNGRFFKGFYKEGLWIVLGL